jgi:hypothetical protein
VTTITKKVDRGISPNLRYQFWLSSEDADDGTSIAQGDVFLIEESLGRPAKYLYIETASGTDLTIRLNGRVITYPLRDARLNWPVPERDLENPVERQDTTMAAIAINAEDVFEIDGVLPIRDIQIVAWSAGSFEVFVA